MARKPNYNFEKRRKELERQSKKEAKARRKLEHASEPEQLAESEAGESTDIAPATD